MTKLTSLELAGSLSDEQFYYHEKVGLVPVGWRVGRLKEFCLLQRGHDLTDEATNPGPFPVIKSNGIGGHHAEGIVEPPGVVTGRSGTIGNVFYIEEKFWPHNTTLYVKDFRGNYPRFIFYSIQRLRFDRYFAGTTIPTLNRNDVHKLWVAIPADRSEQIAIAEALGAVDSAIVAVQETVVNAERLQKGLMQQLLTGRIKSDGTPRQGEFQETKLGLLPKDWTAARVKDFGPVSTGKTPPTVNEANFGQDYPFITPGDMGDTKWLSQTERSLSDLGAGHAGVLPANAVCVVCIGATIGKVGLTVRPACTNQQINTITCADGHSHEYLYYALRYRARHLQVIAGVNATPQLNKSEFSKYRLPMPATLEEEAAIGARLALFDDLVEAKKQKIVALQRLKKSLMQNLLTGRIRLPLKGGAKEATA